MPVFEIVFYGLTGNCTLLAGDSKIYEGAD